MGVYLLSGKLYLRIPCSYTNRSGTPSWTMSLSMCKKERILTTAMKTHAVVWGIFSSRAFLFADSRRSNKNRNNWTTTAKRLTAGWARGTVRVDSWAPSNFLVLTGSFQCSPFDLHALMLCHILIFHHIMLTFCDQFSICASFAKNYYVLSDAYLEHLRYLSMSTLFPWVGDEWRKPAS